MFGSVLNGSNTTYIQNNYYGSGIKPSLGSVYGGCCMPYYGGSIFNMPSFGLPYSFFNFDNFMMPQMCYPMMPFSGYPGFWGGFWGCGGRLWEMLTSVRLLQFAFDSFSRLTDNISLQRSSRKKSSTHAQPSYRISPSSSVSTHTTLPHLTSIGYNADKGQRLASAALSNAVGFTNYCAKYVRIALEKSGLSNGMRADAADYTQVLRQNKNFKEISTAGLNLSSLPAGCILVYGRGVAGYSSEYGHVEITTGTGKAVSDGITNNIRDGARVFVPV